jgi:hypothetical protein
MSKKILIIVIVFVVLIGGAWLFLNFGVKCYDGQGFIIYLSKEQLLKNIESTNAAEAERYFIPPTISVGYIAKAGTNSCGKTISRVIIENGAEKSVSQSKFDKFINDYNAQCGDCLMLLFQSGNSPLFVRDYPSGQSYILKNNNGTLLLESTEKTTNTTSNGTVFQFDKPFTISGVPLPETNFPPRYTSNEILEKSLVTVRAVQFWSNACDRETMPSDTCPFKNEQMVRISFSVAEPEGASWHVKEHYFTDKTLKVQNYEGYQLEVLSIDSQTKQATIVIRKVQ